MFGIFREIPEALQRTVDIASRCNVKIDRIPNPFPEFKVPDGHTAGSYFEKVVREGFATRAPYLERLAKSGALSNPLSEYERRLSSEIQMIQKMRYEGYFLIVWDFIHYARSQGVPSDPAGIGGGKPCKLCVADYGRRSAAIQPALRAVPESGTCFDAGY